MRWMQQLHAQGHADTGPAPAEGGIEQAPAADACQVSLGSARVVAHATAHALADISMASSSKATDGRMPETASNDDTPYAQQQLQCPAAAASIAEADSDLPLASPADGKHPVTWRCVEHTVWCEVGRRHHRLVAHVCRTYPQPALTKKAAWVPYFMLTSSKVQLCACKMCPVCCTLCGLCRMRKVAQLRL